VRSQRLDIRDLESRRLHGVLDIADVVELTVGNT